ncbi:hypothetical protein [Streptomyces sp. NPDC048349]|uniref:hypothetical protein n=1 Tax=Streptomyces sp. NPDC048349 TaxID=3155486 RepID=UPI00341DEC7D
MPAPAAACESAATVPARSKGQRLAAVVATLGALVLPLVGPAPAHAATRDVEVYYGHEHYDISFIGTVKSTRPNGYEIDGELNGYCSAGAATTQDATLAYRGAGDAWGHKPRSCHDLPQHFHFTGTRQSGGLSSRSAPRAASSTPMATA